MIVMKYSKYRYAAISAVMVVAVLVIVVGTALSSDQGQQPRLVAISNIGVPVATLSERQTSELIRAGIARDVRMLGERAGIRFYTGENNGNPCFITSNTEAAIPEFSVVACLGPKTGLLPSVSEPIVDFSAFKKERDANASTVNWMAGFAADNVAAVGVVHADGSITSVPVDGNIYAARSPTSAEVTAIVALDAEGSEVFRRSLPTFTTP